MRAAMAGDERRADTPDQPAVDQLRHRLRGYAIVVVLFLLGVRVLVPPIVQVFGGAINDDGVVLFTLAGTLLVLLGLEVPSFFGGRK
jgi:hypothetical protein